MEATVLPREQAEKEVNDWLDFKKMKPRRREEKKDAIEKLIEAVMDGDFVIDSETFKIKYKLSHPLKAEVVTDELIFSPRANAGAIQGAMNDVKSDNVYETITAYVAVLTDKHKNVIKKLDVEDYNMANRIAIFFM